MGRQWWGCGSRLGGDWRAMVHARTTGEQRHTPRNRRYPPLVQGRCVGATWKPPLRPSSWFRMNDLPCKQKEG